MADETTTTTETPPKPDPAVEARAREMGWTPKEQYKGRPELYLDAPAYVKRGEEVLPYLRATTRRQEEELGRLRAENQRLAEQQRADREQLDAALEFQTDLKKRIVATDEAALTRELAEAREAGDTAREVRTIRALNKLDEEAQPTKVETRPNGGNGTEKPPPRAPNFEDTPEGKSFIAANPWWRDDPMMRGAAVGIGQALAVEGKLDGLTPAQRLEKIAEETLRFANRTSSSRSAPTRVESGGSSEAGSGGSESEHSWADLPQEARDACLKQGKSLVGPNRRFKSDADWRKYYLAAYFKDWGNVRTEQ